MFTILIINVRENTLAYLFVLGSDHRRICREATNQLSE